MTAPAMTVLLGGVIGSELAPQASLATLPITLMVLGMALTSYPAALIMQGMGRKKTFLAATFLACSGALLASIALKQNSFLLFSFACLLIGINSAIVQQYRFAVMESVLPEQVTKALSFLMFSGIFAAYLGPEIATRLSHWASGHLYVGSFWGLCILLSFAFVALCFYKNTPATPHNKQSRQAQRGAVALLAQVDFLVAVAAGTLAFTVMSMIMTVTPISMHVVDHFSVDDTASVIQSHIIAMYLPSLLSAYFITRLGMANTLMLGASALVLCSLVALWERHFVHYWFALVLLGLGWNLLFMAGTAALAKTHDDNEKFMAQAINDGAIFACQAIATLAAGALMHRWGWTVIHAINLVLLAFFIFFIVWKKSNVALFDKNKSEHHA